MISRHHTSLYGGKIHQVELILSHSKINLYIQCQPKIWETVKKTTFFNKKFVLF